MYKVEWYIGASDDLWTDARAEVGRLVSLAAEPIDATIMEKPGFDLSLFDRGGEMRVRCVRSVTDFACRMKLAFLEAAEAITIQPTEPE